MRILRQFFGFLTIVLGVIFMAKTSLATNASIAPKGTKEGEFIALQLKDGTVMIRLRPDLAPSHVARIKELSNQGFYDGLKFHRVIPGFMAQTGDPRGNGTGGSGKNLKAEFSNERHKRGTVSMARASSPDSGDSQFFICFADAPHLDGQYTVWGEVISGMEFVDMIKKGHGGNGEVSDPADTIVSMKVVQAAEVKLP
jgi:peptidylprolyl isomerase